MPLFFIALAIAQADAGDVERRGGVQARRRGDRLRHRGRSRRRSAGGGGRRRGRASGGSSTTPWLQVVPVAAAVLAYSLADGLGGSGFIAAFVGGMVFGGLRRRHGGEVGYLVEELGGVLSAVTFIVFGAVMLGPALGDDDLVDRALRRAQPDGRAHAPGRDRDARHRARAGPRSASSAGSGRAGSRRSSSP